MPRERQHYYYVCIACGRTFRRNIALAMEQVTAFNREAGRTMILPEQQPQEVWCGHRDTYQNPIIVGL